VSRIVSLQLTTSKLDFLSRIPRLINVCNMYNTLTIEKLDKLSIMITGLLTPCSTLLIVTDTSIYKVDLIPEQWISFMWMAFLTL